MQSDFKNNLLLLDDEEILKRISENYFSEENESIAIDFLKKRGVQNLELKIKKIEEKNEIEKLAEIDKNKKLNKIFLVISFIVAALSIHNLIIHLNFKLETNIFRDILLVLLIFLPLILAYYKQKLNVIALWLVGSIVLELLSFLILKTGGWWFILAWISSFYLIFRKAKLT